jgi:hypothetical protein
VLRCGAPPDAEQVVTELAGKISTAEPGVVFTAETDPNKLLGRPNGYLSKATFTDARIPSDGLAAEPGSVAAGGSVEVFADEDRAVSRKDYVDGIGQAAPALANEYSYLDGPVLVRVSGQLTPSQAAEYEAAVQQ